MHDSMTSATVSATRVAERVEEAVEEAEVAEAFQTIAAGTEHETVDGATEAGYVLRTPPQVCGLT